MSARELAYIREFEANMLKEDEIWFSIVNSFVKLQLPTREKAEMLFSAVGNDLSRIENALDFGIRHSLFLEYSLEEAYKELIEIILNYRY